MEEKELLLPEHAGERLDTALSSALGVSRSRAQELIGQGLVLIDGSPSGKSHRLTGVELITVRPPLEKEYGLEAQPIPLSIIYQDKDIAVISKQAGLVVHPAAGHRDGTLVNALLHALPDLGLVGDEVRPGIVHRLDRDTSGLMVVAKHQEALGLLQGMVRRRDIRRRYLALINGAPKSTAGTIDAPVGRDPRDRKRMAVTEEGREALTNFEVLQALNGYSLVEVELITGRTHQIRVHFAYIGHPVAGDRVYGRQTQKDRTEGLRRQFLHAWRLEFLQPLTGEPLSFKDPLPADLAVVLEALGGSLP